MNRIVILIFVFPVSELFCAKLPVKPCRLLDSECLKNSAQSAVPVFAAGLPELDIETLDVMNVDNMKLSLSGLEIEMSKIKITGLKDSKINKLSFDMNSNKINLEYITDVNMKGDYKCKGRLLALPIHGEGAMDISLNKIKVHMVMPFQINKSTNGKSTININSSNYTYEILGNMRFYLSNLFDGNKQLSDAMLNAINDNWKEVAELFGPAVLEKPVALIAKDIKKYFRANPLEEIAVL